MFEKPAEKESTDIALSNSGDSSTQSPSIKFKANKVADVNRSPQAAKRCTKIRFANEVGVNGSPTRTKCKIKPESEMGYSIEDVNETTNPESIAESIQKTKSVRLPRERVIDMSPEDQKQWELEEMLKPIDLQKANVHIDPSPFQLVERTSILKVHSLFSMVGINHAYVTKIGRLVGVVGLKELRKAIEDINSNSFVPPTRDEDADEKPAVEKPLLSTNSSDKAVDMTVTSMDSALSNSENCSDIEMEHIKHTDKGTVSLTMPPQESKQCPPADSNNTENGKHA